MPKSLVERRLSQVAGRLQQLRAELDVSGEQLAHLADAADDARLRALVSETPVADVDHRHAERHAEAMRRHRATVLDEIAKLERDQDELLDRLPRTSRMAGPGPGRPAGEASTSGEQGPGHESRR